MSITSNEACVVCERNFYDSERLPNTKIHWGIFNFCGDCDLEMQNRLAMDFIKWKENGNQSI